MKLQEKKLKVSVCVVTFNQKDYIRECLDSLINQDALFDFEIIVGDDASTDGTSKIVAEYASKYPNLIVSVLHDKNIGAVANLVSVYTKARGEYIAHVDGDDYVSLDKLRRQVAVLDENEDCAICSHDIVIVDRNSVELKRRKKFSFSVKKNRDYLVAHLPFFAHSSKLFRNDTQLNYYAHLPVDTVDFELHLRHLTNNNVYHIADFLGFYRVGVGVALSDGKINEALPAATRRVFEELLAHNKSRYSHNELQKIYSSSILRYATGSFILGDFINGKTYAEESMEIKIFSIKQVLIIFFFWLPNLLKVRLLKLYRSIF